MAAKPSIGEFSERRWGAARKKIAASQNAVLSLGARTADFQNQTITLYVHANPPSGSEHLQTGTIEVTRALLGLDAMAFWDATHGIVVGDSVNAAFSILLTSDGGKTWTPAPPAGLPTALPGEGAFAASGTNVAVHGANDAWFATGAAAKARVLHTRDRGRSWTIADTPLVAGKSAGAFSVAFRDASHGVVVGGDYQKEAEAIDNLAVTSDGGRTWTLVKERGLSGFRSVVAYVPGTKMSVIAVGPQGSDWSKDVGRTWTPIEGTGFHAFSFSKSGRAGFGAGSKGSIGKLATSGR